MVDDLHGNPARLRLDVVRRHVGLCLQYMDISEANDKLIMELTTKFVTEEAYAMARPGADPAKRAAFQQEMQVAMGNARAVLGDELSANVFMKKPPMAILEVVRDEPTTGYYPLVNGAMSLLGMWPWYTETGLDRLQPRRLGIAPAADGCKPCWAAPSSHAGQIVHGQHCRGRARSVPSELEDNPTDSFLKPLFLSFR